MPELWSVYRTRVRKTDMSRTNRVCKTDMSRTNRVRKTDMSRAMVRWSGPVRFLDTTDKITRKKENVFYGVPFVSKLSMQE